MDDVAGRSGSAGLFGWAAYFQGEESVVRRARHRQDLPPVQVVSWDAGQAGPVSSGAYGERAMGLEPRMVAYYRELYINHRANPDTNRCHICNVGRCADFLFARGSLIAAGISLPEE